MFAIFVVAVLLFTTTAVSSIFCDGESDSEESGDDTFEEFSWEDDSGGDAGTCGGGDHPGPGPPQ